MSDYTQIRRSGTVQSGCRPPHPGPHPPHPPYPPHPPHPHPHHHPHNPQQIIVVPPAGGDCFPFNNGCGCRDRGGLGCNRCCPEERPNYTGAAHLAKLANVPVVPISIWCPKECNQQVFL